VPEGAAALEAPRRHLSGRQAEVVQRLLDAAVEEARASPYEAITVRTVARRAGVAPATAYTYFSSKEHVFAEVLWRRFAALPAAEPRSGDPGVRRAEAVFDSIGTFLADEPALAAAGAVALLGTGPDVRQLRDRIGDEIHDRLAAALGPAADRQQLLALELAYIGAMLSAGMGHFPFSGLPRVLADVATAVLGGTR